MARKNKGAALFELLYKDKNKSTTPDGALKMPSWFRSMAQPGQPAGSLADKAAPSGGPAATSSGPSQSASAAGASAGQSAGSSQPRGAAGGGASAQPTGQSQPGGTSAGGAMPQPTGAADPHAPLFEVHEPSPASAESAESAPAPGSDEPAGEASRGQSAPAAGGSAVRSAASAGGSATVTSMRPWATGARSRPRLINNKPIVYSAVGVAAVLVLLAAIALFRGGETNRPETATNSPVEPASLEDVRREPADPGVITRLPGGGGEDIGTSAGAAEPDTAQSPRTYAQPGPERLEAGWDYVYVQTFSGSTSLDAATQVRDYLQEQGFDLLVCKVNGGQYHLIRSRGMKSGEAKRMADDLLAAMEKLAAEKPGLIRFDPADARLRPFVRPYR